MKKCIERATFSSKIVSPPFTPLEATPFKILKGMIAHFKGPNNAFILPFGTIVVQTRGTHFQDHV